MCESQANEVEVNVKVHIDQTEIDEMMRKFERIALLEKEANSLVHELASEEKHIKVSFECDD